MGRPARPDVVASPMAARSGSGASSLSSGDATTLEPAPVILFAQRKAPPATKVSPAVDAPPAAKVSPAVDASPIAKASPAADAPPAAKVSPAADASPVVNAPAKSPDVAASAADAPDKPGLNGGAVETDAKPQVSRKPDQRPSGSDGVPAMAMLYPRPSFGL